MSFLLPLARITQPLRFKHASRHRYLALSRTTLSGHEPLLYCQKQWQKSGAADLLLEKSRLKKGKMYAVLERQKNYELAFSHPESLSVERFTLLLDCTRSPATAFFRLFFKSRKTTLSWGPGA